MDESALVPVTSYNSVLCTGRLEAGLPALHKINYEVERSVTKRNQGRTALNRGQGKGVLGK